MHNLTKFFFSYTFNRSVVSICPNLMSLPGFYLYPDIISIIVRLWCAEGVPRSTYVRNILRDNFLTIWVFVVPPFFLLYSFFVSLTLLLDIPLCIICCVCICCASYYTQFTQKRTLTQLKEYFEWESIHSTTFKKRIVCYLQLIASYYNDLQSQNLSENGCGFRDGFS